MSTAPTHTFSASPARADSLGARWERLLAVASVCLPIPLLAATGLSIPLPSSVERIGAALVAWTDQGPETAPLPVSGDIVLTDARQAAPEPREQVGAAGARTVLAKAVATPATDSTAQPGAKAGGGKNGGGSGGSGDSPDAGGSSPPANGGGNAPTQPQPNLVEGTVNEVTTTTQPVIDVVDDTVNGLGQTVDELLPTEDLLGNGGLLGSGK
jgi:hypothetical protein